MLRWMKFNRSENQIFKYSASRANDGIGESNVFLSNSHTQVSFFLQLRHGICHTHGDLLAQSVIGVTLEVRVGSLARAKRHQISVF